MICAFTRDIIQLQSGIGHEYSIFIDGSYKITPFDPLALLDSTQDRRAHGRATAAIEEISPLSELSIVALCITASACLHN